MTERTAARLAVAASVLMLAGILVYAAVHGAHVLVLLAPWLATVLVAKYAVGEYLEADDQGSIEESPLWVLAAILALAIALIVVFAPDAGANHQDPVCHQGTTLWLPPEGLATHLDQAHVPVPGHEGDFYGTCEGGDPNYDVDPPIDDCAVEYVLPEPECDADVGDPLVVTPSVPPQPQDGPVLPSEPSAAPAVPQKAPAAYTG